MRIIAGLRRGMVLRGFDSPSIRPTKDQVKESMFNILGNLVDWPSCVVCDLFSGTGSLGIESLSRGARSATLVEQDPDAIGVLRHNLKKSRLEASARIVQQDAIAFLTAQAPHPYDVVFADPPYEARLGYFVVEKLYTNGYLGAHGVLVYESAPDETFPEDGRFPGLLLHRRRTWGRTLISVYCMAGQ